MNYRIITGLFLVFFISGCLSFPLGGKGDKSDQPVKFDSKQYLVAKGYGKTKSDSISQAKAELANIFEARISSDVTSQVKQITDSNSGSSFTKSIESDINVQSNVELQGVQVGEPRRWLLEFVTEAAIDKAQARETWTRDIQNIDAQMDVLLDKANTEKSKLQKFLPLKKALVLWVEREAALSRLRVVDGQDIQARDFKSIIEPISEIKSSMLVYLAISGSEKGAVRDVVSEILTDNGFKVTDSKSQSDVVIDGKVTVEKINNSNQRFKFSRATVSINILDRKTRAQVGQVKESEQGEHLNYEEATHLAITRVSKRVADKIVQYFN